MGRWNIISTGSTMGTKHAVRAWGRGRGYFIHSSAVSRSTSTRGAYLPSPLHARPIPFPRTSPPSRVVLIGPGSSPKPSFNHVHACPAHRLSIHCCPSYRRPRRHPNPLCRAGSWPRVTPPELPNPVIPSADLLSKGILDLDLSTPPSPNQTHKTDHPQTLTLLSSLSTPNADNCLCPSASVDSKT